MSRMVQFVSGCAVMIVLPIILVIALIFAALSGVEEASACVVQQDDQSGHAYPVSATEPVVPFRVGLNLHYGVDFAAKDDKEGEPVLATKDGKVIAAGGDTVKIQHQSKDNPRDAHPVDDVQTWFKYVKNIKVSVGQAVKKGQQIAEIGSGDEPYMGTGATAAKGPHLHFEVHLNDPGEGNDVRDPMEFLKPIDMGGSGCGCESESGPLVGANNPQKAFNFFVSKGYTKQQAAGIVGNMTEESSGVNPGEKQGAPYGDKTSSKEAINFGDDVGWGIVQWTPPNKMIKPSRDAGVPFDKIDTLEYQLDFLWKQLDGKTAIPEGEAGKHLKGTSTVNDATESFLTKYERAGVPRLAERVSAAQEVFKAYGGGGAGTAEGGKDGCAVSGSIAQTAWLLAWPSKHSGIDKADAKPDYQREMPKHNKEAAEGPWYPYTDCGVFVATVIRMTFDPKYYSRGTAHQLEYAKANPDKYEIISDIKSTSQLKPGDIMMTSGHTYMYTGKYTGSDGQKYDSAAASWACEDGNCEYARTPQVENWWPEEGYVAIRPKQGGKS